MMLPHKLEGEVIHLLAMTSCISQLDTQQDTLNVLRHFCPYNDFCQTPATRVVSDKLQSSCCRRCSCDEDCELLQSCCPDKEHHDHDKTDILNTMQLACKTVAVGWTRPSIMKQNDTYRTNYPHFLIKDQCPVNETNQELKRKCNSTDMSRFDGFSWVSDNATGQIFQNRFCASCHSVRHFVYWKIGIKDCIYPLNDSLPVESIFQTNNCYLVLDEPSNMEPVTTKYRCFIPDVSQCNATGNWTEFNETISTGCNSYDMPFIKETAAGVISSIFKNVLCYICSGPSSDGIMRECRKGNFKYLTTISFTMIIDINRLKKKKYETTCRFDEIFDRVLGICHRIYCQLGWIPSGGVCLKTPFVNPMSSIGVFYKLKLLLPTSTVVMDRYFFELVYNRIRTNGIAVLGRALGYEDIGCKPCIQHLFFIPYPQNKSMGVGMGNFYLYNQVTTSSQCDFETLRIHMISYLGTSVVLDPEFLISFMFESLIKDDVDYITGNYTSFGHFAKPFFCGNLRTLTSTKVCPRLVLSYPDIVSLPSGKVRSELFVLFNNSDDDNLEICTKDYFDLLSRTSEGNRLEQVTISILVAFACSTLISVV